jgi:hypothetical protein
VRRELAAEAYVYREVRNDTVRCLALSAWGGVYEGDLTVLDGGALQLDLKGYEGDGDAPHVALVSLGGSGRLRARVWCLHDAARTLRFDLEHARPGPK